MAFKFEIIDNSIQVSDTVTSEILIDQTAKSSWFDNSSLKDGFVKIYSFDAINNKNIDQYSNDSFVGFPVAECVNSLDVAFTIQTFRDFCHVGLGKSNASVSGAKAFFTVESNDTLVIPDYPSRGFISGLVAIGSMIGLEIDTLTNSVVNVSGRNLELTGTLAFQIVRDSGGGTTDVKLLSESSFDGGVTWVKNDSSYRASVLARDGVAYSSPFSFTESPWIPNQRIRFSFSVDGRSATIRQVSDTFEGDAVTSHSLIWSMSEH